MTCFQSIWGTEQYVPLSLPALWLIPLLLDSALLGTCNKYPGPQVAGELAVVKDEVKSGDDSGQLNRAPITHMNAASIR